ncbi:MAG: hypothetical protein GX050_00145 [Firmicutes bacterium]|nr:hypothetical protein [Bacillota bacterium]
MFPVDREDLVRALKRFKSLAKQDLLTSELTSDPVFWQTHAEARRNEYTRLIDLIENFGVEKACVYAFKAYQEQQQGADEEQTGEQRGSTQALELFFQIMGLSLADLKSMGEEKEETSVYSSPLSLEC